MITLSSTSNARLSSNPEPTIQVSWNTEREGWSVNIGNEALLNRFGTPWIFKTLDDLVNYVELHLADYYDSETSLEIMITSNLAARFLQKPRAARHVRQVMPQEPRRFTGNGV